MKSWVAQVAVGAMIAGSLVTVGVGAQMALAAPDAPEVTTSPADPPLVAGEEGVIDVSFSNGDGAIGSFNLSAALVLPDGVRVTGTGALGTPTKTYTHADGALPGAYGTSTDCEAMGLAAGPSAGKCRVPEGSRLFVFENISDLPESAANRTSVTILPDADIFEPGTVIPYVFTGFTSDNPNMLPVFPGSSSKALNANHTSAPGAGEGRVPVEALRIEKSEPSPENELLRGVHDHQTVYTLRISHTGEGDVTNAKVVDYLPAGLEYLGSGQADRTETANGSGSAEEYAGSGSMAGKTGQPANWREEESIVTVRGGFVDGEFVESADGAVFTKVTWDLATLLAADGTAQDYAAKQPGTAGIIELQYVAGIPLFENSYIAGSFDETAAGVHGALGQGANLDNNTGLSTRHGDASDDDDAAGDLGPWRPNTLTNTGTVFGDYTLQNQTVYTSSASDDEIVEAVDVRLVKSVDDTEFKQGGVANYKLTVSTSEYVTAQLADEAGSSADVRPNRLVDDLADGICPAFPADVAVTPGASTQTGLPNLRIGDPSAEIPAADSNLTAAEWNARLGGASGCKFPSDRSDAKLSGATLTGIAYDPATGHFFLDLWIDEMGRSDVTEVEYSALQNTAYSEGDGKPGATSSGDRVKNSAEILMTTFPTADTADVENSEGTGVGGEWRAAEDSEETLRAAEGGLKKYVLPRSAGTQTADTITGTGLSWADDRAPEPFAAGDEVWYRIDLIAPGKAEVRNPKLSDYLPAGVELPAGWPNAVDASDPSKGYTDYVIVPPSTLNDYGTCSTTGETEWLTKYVGGGAPSVTGSLLTWNLGSNDCVAQNTTDRFLPIASPITVYVKGIVTGTAASDAQDLPQNLAKYQQQGRINERGDMEVFFLRDEAEIELDRTAQLVKGVAAVTRGATTRPDPANGFKSDIDGVEVVQGDEVTYRLDVTAPFTDTTGYIIWDVLPKGVTAADVVSGGYSAQLVEDGAEIAGTVAYTAQAYDAGSFPSGVMVKDAFKDRSIIVWKVTSTVPASTRGVPAIPGEDGAAGTPAVPAVERGLTLGYTVAVPAGVTDGGAAAQITQQYVNDASIVEFGTVNTGGGTSAVIIDGTENVAVPRVPTDEEPGYVFSDEKNETSDPSDVFLPGAKTAKTLVRTEVNPAGSDPADPNNTTKRTGAVDQRPDDAIVQGEYATYEYSVTIPGNTTVTGGKLADEGKLRWTSTPTPPNNREVQYNFVDGSAKFRVQDQDGAVDPDFDFDGLGFTRVTNAGDDSGLPGTLVFPESYTNTTLEPQTFVAQIQVWVEDRDESTSAYNPNFPNNKTLTNTASFSFSDPNSATPKTITEKKTADVRYLEPEPTLAKTVIDPADGVVGADGNVTFKLTAGNANDRVALYDSVVYDCLPAGFSVPSGAAFAPSQGAAEIVEGGCTVSGTGAAQRVAPGGGSGTLIKWTVGRIDAGAANAQTLEVTAKVDSAAGGGQSLTNRAHIVGYTLPETIDGKSTADRRGDRAVGVERDVKLADAGIVKSVTTPNGRGSAAVGETVRYTLTTTLPAHANFYDVTLSDMLPEGVSYAGNQSVTHTGWLAGPTVSEAAVGGDGRSLSWTITPNDIALHTGVRTITVSFDAKITDAIRSGTPRNTAKFTWNKVNGDNSSVVEKTGTVDVTILNPVVGIEKKVDGANSVTRDPAASFDYTLRVKNTGNTPAHNITIVDRVPAGVVVDPATISTVQGVSGVLSGNDATTGGGTITWTKVPGPLAVLTDGAAANETIELSYTATFAPSATLTADDFPYENYVNVTSYESFGRDGWVYTPPQHQPDGTVTPGGKTPGGTNVPAANDEADVTPLFPHVVPKKSVTAPVAGKDYGLAYVNEPFGWTLTVENQGRGTAKTLTVTDRLPLNWTYKPGSSKIDGVAIGDPVRVDQNGATGQQLIWAGDALESVTPLAADTKFAITFEAIPGEAAIDTPGTGVGSVQHVHRNTLSVTATDTQDADENGDGGYVGDDDTADAYIAEADLKLEKAAIGGVVEQSDPAKNLYGLSKGAWVPGQGVVADAYAQPQWRITVTNHGPDASVGPFEVVDTQTLPAGVATGGWSARYHPAGGGAAVALPLSGTGTAADPFVIGDGTTQLNAAGTDRIVITANVSIAAGATATAEQLKNVAKVVGQTFERESKQGENATNPNIDDAKQPLTPVADLAIEKTVNTPSVDLGAGKPISWSLRVTNLGPSTSLSGTEKITVSDTIPAGITAVANPSNATWTATLNGAAWAADATAKAGDEITWTYTGASIAPGQSVAAITLSGTIEPAHEADTAIANTATVAPGDTPDPNDPNNKSTVTVTPSTETSISIDKTRVVKNDAGEWVAAGDIDPVPAPVPGENVSYRITVVNNGPAVARGVIVTDELPEYLSYVGVENGVGAWATDNAAGDRDLRFTLTDPAPLKSPVGLAADSTANTVSFVVTTKLDSDFVMDEDAVVENTAVADADNADPDSDDDTSNTPSRDARLSIEKTHSGDPIAGTAIPYTITVTNDGPSAARGPIVVTDALPAGLGYVADSARVAVNGGAGASQEPTITNDGSDLAWTVGTAADSFTLPVGSTIVVTLNVLIDANIADGVKQNGATADGPDGPKVTTTDEIDIEREADMSLVKQVQNAAGEWVDEATAVAGENVSYLLTVTNDGPSANPATLSDALPEHLTLVSATPVDDAAGWDCSASVEGSQTAVCSSPLLPVGMSQIRVETTLAPGAVAGAANQTAEFVNTATLSWNDRDAEDPDEPNTVTDTAKVTATAEADLVLTKRVWDQTDEAWADSVRETAGEEAWFRVDVHNDGPSDVIAPIRIEDELPAGLAFERLSGDDTLSFWQAHAGAVDPDTGRQTVVFTPRDETAGLNAGQDLPPLRYVTNIASNAASEAVLVNTAEVTSGTEERDPDNNRDTAEVVIDRVADLAVAKSHDTSGVRVGDELEFGIVVTNNGPSDSSGAVVTDTVPAGLTVLSSPGDAGEGWTIESVETGKGGTTTVVARYAASLAVGESAPVLTIVTRVEAAAYPSVVNAVDVVPADERERDPEPSNDHAEDPVTVPPLVTLVTEKTAVGDFQVGGIGEYAITVENLGPTADPGPITVVDALPAGLTFRESPKLPTGVSLDVRGQTVTWTIENGLAVDEQVSLGLLVNIGQAAYPEVKNSVGVDSEAEKTVDSKVVDTATAKVQAVDALVVTGGDLAAFAMLAALLLLLGGAAALLAKRRRDEAEAR